MIPYPYIGITVEAGPRCIGKSVEGGSVIVKGITVKYTLLQAKVPASKTNPWISRPSAHPDHLLASYQLRETHACTGPKAGINAKNPRRAIAVDHATVAFLEITSSSNPAPPRSSPQCRCESLVPARVRTCSNAGLGVAPRLAFLILPILPVPPRRHEN